MTPKEFHNLLTESVFTREETNQAWRLYHSKGSEQAVAFLEEIALKFESIRRSQQLKNSAVPYKVYGEEHIEQEAIEQMQLAAHLPVAVAGALMPDAHLGYGLPIGGVLATENSVIPYAVGVDIACRMMLSVFPVTSDVFKDTTAEIYRELQTILLKNTYFGSGEAGTHDGKIEHPVLEASLWDQTPLTKSLREIAVKQIGTSGGGNHFVEWGDLEISKKIDTLPLPPGKYLALLTHSGSRGVGFKIANHYTRIAMDRLAVLNPKVRHLAWLPMNHDLGREYWDAMQLAGQFASACHHVIHQRMSQCLGVEPIVSVENHHNFAWKERIHVNGREIEAIVHRKGATPAGKGVLGIIPGTMADPGYLVMGKGNEDSLNSASHGSGRSLTRTKAKKLISHEEHKRYLKNRGVDLIGGGLDEAPQAYKDINAVIHAQNQLIEVLGTFMPRIVRMAEEDSPV